MIRHVVIAALALASGGAIAHFYVAAQAYQPIVRVRTPDHVTYTAVLDSVRNRPACGVASDRFLAPIVTDCPECRVVLARCRREGETLPAFARDAAPEGRSLVEMPGLVIAIDAEPQTARSMCEWIAANVTSRGVRHARCLPPGSGRIAQASLLQAR